MNELNKRNLDEKTVKLYEKNIKSREKFLKTIKRYQTVIRIAFAIVLLMNIFVAVTLIMNPCKSNGWSMIFNGVCLVVMSFLLGYNAHFSDVSLEIKRGIIEETKELKKEEF